MHIVIHAGGIPFNGETINERSLGGSESAAYYTAKEFAARGHRVVVFTESKQDGIFDEVIYLWMGERKNNKPLGENWHFYCEHTPHDVNIVQRQVGSFMFHIQSKINLWWAHDIALKRSNNPFMAQTWQTDRVLPVSNWFKSQIQEAWLCNPEIITPVHNGVDYSLYERELKDNTQEQEMLTMLYSSRPERGLERLVREGGIMERLLEEAPHIKLLVCGYEHPVPQLDGYYDYLKGRCEELSNVEHLGALKKEELVKLQCTKADVWCYPTEFEEVSCITAMECMAAGMYVATTNTAALPETLGDYENVVRFNNDEKVEDKFVNWLKDFDNKFRRRPYRVYTWTRVADEFEEIIDDCFAQYQDTDAIARHFLRNSDISALRELGYDNISENIVNEVENLYSPWMFDPKEYAKHYVGGTERMYDSEDFHYESKAFKRHPRFVEVAKYIHENCKDGDLVYDYGCAHGMFTNYLADNFPNINFRGVDVSPAAVRIANVQAEKMGLKNVIFFEEDWLDSENSIVDFPYNCDVVILGEILEHVPDPVKFMDIVKQRVGAARVIITTPQGPWESLSYEKDYPERYHLHHFEREDLSDMFSHHVDFDVRVLPASHTQIGELIGWYVTAFTFSEEDAAFEIDYERKIKYTRPRQTATLCMIVKNAEETILKTLKSMEPYVDEIVVGVDETTTDRTLSVLEDFQRWVLEKHRSPFLEMKVFSIPSPIEIGFDEARNLTVDQATKHWIIWCDADEEFIGGDRLPKYLRKNGWDGYGIPQHHFSTEPLGVLSTDFPVRIFRRNEKIRFRGVVHEHPEHEDHRNEGVGFAFVLNELHFTHYGYTTEEVRRRRFQRNIKLMYRDREKYPDRLLGKFLWIRDLALMCRFELEQTNGYVTGEMQLRAREGLKLWEETIDNFSDHPQVRRMIKDHLEFYDTLTRVLNQGFQFNIKLCSGPGDQPLNMNGAPELSANFLNRRHLDKFLSVVIDEEVKDYGTKYQ